MKMIYRSIRDLLRHHTGFFLLMLFCVCSSAAVMLFSFGLYQNYQLQKQDFTWAQTDLTFRCDGVTKNEVAEVVARISPNTQSYIYLHCAIFTDDDFWPPEQGGLYARFQYRSGGFQVYPEQEDNLAAQAQVLAGRYYTHAEYKNGEKVILISRRDMYQLWERNHPELVTYDGDNRILNIPAEWDNERLLAEIGTVPVGGEEFTPIMLVEHIGDVPFTAVPADMQVQEFSMCFSIPPTESQAKEIFGIVTDVCGGRVTLPELTPAYDEDYTLYNTVILISVLIAAVAAANIVVLYYYILLKRCKTLAVYMLCGCTRLRAVLLYVGESLLLTVPLFALAAALYHYVLLQVLPRFFPFIATAYSVGLYARAMGIYVGMCTLGMLLLSVGMVYRHSVRDMEGGAA